MPTHIRIIRSTEFFIVNATGEVDFKRTRRLLKKVASTSAVPVPHEILLDMRAARLELSATDLWDLALEVSRRHTPFHGKIAVLCRTSGEGQAAFFALCAQNRGFPVRAFTSFEEAVEWLVEGRPLLEYTA
jgi:hypothetical protein